MMQRIVTVFLCVALFPSARLAGQQPHSNWSVRLDKYGYSRLRQRTALAPYSKGVLGGKKSHVALAIALKESATIASQSLANSRSNLSLFIFDANDGALTAKC